MRWHSWRWAQVGGGIGYEIHLERAGGKGQVKVASPGYGRLTIDGPGLLRLLELMRETTAADGTTVRRWDKRHYMLAASPVQGSYLANIDYPWVNFAITQLLPREAQSLTVAQATDELGVSTTLGYVPLVNLRTPDMVIDPAPLICALELFGQKTAQVSPTTDLEALAVEVALMNSVQAHTADLQRVQWRR